MVPQQQLVQLALRLERREAKKVLQLVLLEPLVARQELLAKLVMLLLLVLLVE